MVNVRVLCLTLLLFVVTAPVSAQGPRPERSLVDDLLECSVFYETHGALLTRSNKPVDDLWDKADTFKREGIQLSKDKETFTEQQIQTRMSYLIKKWTKRLLYAARLNHQQKQDIKLWTRFCNELGEVENILPLN